MRVLRKRGPMALGLCVDEGFTDLKDVNIEHKFLCICLVNLLSFETTLK